MTTDIFEVHVVDHCNLKCKGCSHFSPLVTNKEFADYNLFKKDIKRLSEIYSNIKEFRILGGEPLLNPNLTDFLIYSRRVLPKSNISLVTNGTLLDRQNHYFWDTCKENNVTIKLSNYPIDINKESIVSKCKAYGIALNISVSRNQFFKFINIKGDSNPNRSFKNCKTMLAYPILKNGHIYPCAFACLYKIFNKFSDKQIITEDDYNRIDIHSHTAIEITKFLKQSIPLCEFCITKRPTFKWGISKKNTNEWIGENDNGLKHQLLILKYRAYNLLKYMRVK